MPQPKDDTRLERRSMQVREFRADDDGKIVGYAAVFDEEADIGGMFREVVKPGAFARAIKEKQDVRALWNHDSNHILGRTKAGTLELREDDKGLWIEIDPPNTILANGLMESMKRGDVDNMSFAFIATEETWTERKDEPTLREIKDLDLFDISPVVYPAYQGTSVGLRSAESIFNDHIQSLEGQVPEGDDDAEREGLELDRRRAVVDVTKRTNKSGE
jgi:HK97 family phage prohead protease